MKLGMIGLGRMGANMVRRLIRNGHSVAVYNRTPDKTKEIASEGAIPTTSLEEFINALPSPRIVWLMVPAGKPVDDIIDSLIGKLAQGDIVVDGGNSRYSDTQRRYNAFKAKGISYLDAGTSGGIWGLEEGYCLMVGGDEPAYKQLEPIFKSLAPQDGVAYMGPSGSGHYVKMVHNGIEYGMLQAYGEGFEILKNAPFPLDLQKISSLWNHGSVVRSWLLELAVDAFKKDPDLAQIKGVVEDTGEGRWTIEEALNRNVPAPVITLSLLARLRSRQTDSFSAKVIAALRNEFGGHKVVTKTP